MKIRKVATEKSLAYKFPNIAREWHPTKNGDIAPENVKPASGKKIWWKCQKGHEWQTKVDIRTRQGSGCPFCSGRKVSKEENLATLFPEIAAEWHPTKNGNLKPSEFTCANGRKVWWQCKHSKDHEWETIVSHRTRNKSGCPICARRRRRQQI
jgi:hypothetical protein